MIDPVLISIISASTALVASVAGPFVTLYVGRAQIKAAVHSANRQKWIEEFRELIASFCAQIATSTQVREQVFKDGRVSILGTAFDPSFLDVMKTCYGERGVTSPMPFFCKIVPV